LLRSLDNAYRLLSSPAAKAFDLSLEPKDSYEKYNTGQFGLGCLLARRLTEVGARFIEVTTEYIPFKNWDTHDNGHTRLVDLKGAIDAPIAQLVIDLERRGLLDRTLIVLASEFSRDMMVEGRPEQLVKNQVDQPDVIAELKYYGMHRHFTDAGCVLLFGGGAKRGHLHGRTADERPCKTIENRVVIEDLHATIFHALGISPKHGYEIERRPFYVTKDGLGKPILDLLMWREQVECFAGLGFRCIAPDMRGYGGSSVPTDLSAYALQESTQDMLELLAGFGTERAIWVGHDWGSPVVWSLAAHHADRCIGVVNLNVPYLKDGFALPNLIPLGGSNRLSRGRVPVRPVGLSGLLRARV